MRIPRYAPVLAALGLVTVGLATGSPQSAIATPSIHAVKRTTAGTDVDQGITHAQNALVPAGAGWTEQYFASPQADSPTAVELHADVLRPTSVAPGTPTPVILSVGPYFSHAGQTSVETDQTGPSQRFNDLIDGAQLMSRGYTVVLVDLRGFGGSTGCLDWGGSGEQADVKAAVEWAAGQPWSTGKVGTYGKSYDALTGLMANNARPVGLSAVIAQEPLWNPYNYYYSNLVPRPNNTATPNSYNSIVTMRPTTGDSAQYKANAAYEQAHPECTKNNSSSAVTYTSPSDAYWRERDTVSRAVGTSTPLFFTQGFTESNTKPEQMQDWLAAHGGVERAWMGPWEHVRGNETDTSTGQLKMGRSGFFDEVVRFYDLYLKGIQPGVVDPTYAIQGSDGVWRAQSSWPGTTTAGTVTLSTGSYVDNGARASSVSRASSDAGASSASGTASRRSGVSVQQKLSDRGGQLDRQVRSRLTTSANATVSSLATANRYFTFSTALARTTRITATPAVRLQTSGTGNVMVRTYDVDPATKKGVMIDENVARLQSTQTAFALKSLDWKLAAGHRLAVSIGTVDPSGNWSAKASNATITVKSAALDLSTQSPAADVATQGSRSTFLDSYISANTITFTSVPSGTFTVPAPTS